MFWLIIALAVFLDQWTKYAIQTSYVLNETVRFLPGILDITYVHNYGAAFSTLQNKQMFLIIFTSLTMLAITTYTLKPEKNPQSRSSCLCADCGRWPWESYQQGDVRIRGGFSEYLHSSCF